MIRQVPVGRYSALRRTRRSRRLSVRRSRVRDAEAECRDIIRARSRGLCEACTRLHSGKVRAGTMKHEIKSRARGGSPLDPANCLWVDALCHDWIHAHPQRAHELGLLAHSWEQR